MTDRELLELAAKAAGIDAKFFTHADGSVGGPFIGNSGWNPLTDDGDALRLAVRLGMSVWSDPAAVCMAEALKHCLPRCSEPSRSDPYAATRRAIVRAAAEIGKEMP